MDYNLQIVSAKAEQNLEREKVQKLQEQLNTSVAKGIIKVNSIEWLELKTQIAEAESAIKDYDIEIENLKQEKIAAYYEEQFDRAMNKVDQFINKLETINNLIKDEIMFDDDGRLTEMGMLSMALNVNELNKNTENLQTAIKKRQELLNDSSMGAEKHDEMLSQAESEINEYISAISNARDKIIDIVKQQSEAEKDALFDVIDARKTALEKKKDYYEYDKTLKSKTKEINLLKQQIAALDGVSDAESHAKKARLEAQLADAQDDLESTVKDHIYELQVTGLDDLKDQLDKDYEEYAKTLSSNLQEMTDAINNCVNSTAANTTQALATMNNLLKAYGINISAEDFLNISGSFAKGTRHVSRKGIYRTQEKGGEIIVTKDEVFMPLSVGDKVFTNDMTERLYDIASGDNSYTAPTFTLPKIDFPDIPDSGGECVITNHYDSLIHVTTTGTKTINITFSGGWNVFEIWMRRSSSEYCYMDKTISTIPECSIMNCYSSFSSNLKEEKTATLFYREIFNDDGSSRIEQTATQLGWFLETGSTETSIILKDNLIQAITDKYVVKGSDGEVIIQNGSIKAGSITTEMLKFGMGQNIYSTGYDTFENTVNLSYSTMSNSRISIESFSYTDSYGSTAYFGSKCLGVYGTISSSSDYFMLGSEDNYYGTICLNPEKKYIISWYERRMENSISVNNYSANLIVRKSKARDISNIVDTTYSFACNNSWTRHEINYTPDSEYPYISLGFGNLPSINFYIDAIQIEEVDDFSKGASSFSPAINYVINVESLSTNGLASISEKLGTITSGILKSAGYSYSSGNYTSSGYIIDLDNNIIRTPKLYASNSVLAISPTTGSLASYTLSSTYMYRGSSSIGASGNSYSYIGTSGFSLSNKLVYKTSDGSIAFKGGTIATTNIDQDVYFRNKINLYYSTSLTSSTPTSKYGEALSVPSTGTSLVIASGFSGGAEVKNALKVTGNLTVTGDIVDIDSIVSSSGNKAFNYFNANLYKFKNGLKYCFINCASLGAISAGNAVTCTNAIPDDYVPKAPYLNKNIGTISVNDALNVMRDWIGMSRSKGTHKPIIDLYNSHKPLARGYKVSYSDAYCATTISAVFIKLNATDMVGGTECGVEEYIKLFKNKGIWNEDGTIVPEPGYIICYNWDDSTQPNDGYADHIGMVESVDKTNRTITIIEGNLNGNVAKRTITIGWGYIRGYAIPKYKTENTIENTVNDATGGCEVKLERITNGSKGNQVKTIQRILRELGYKGKDGKKLSVDGKCGDNTMYAVAEFQKAVGVKVTTGYGKAVSDKTWKALLNAA